MGLFRYQFLKYNAEFIELDLLPPSREWYVLDWVRLKELIPIVGPGSAPETWCSISGPYDGKNPESWQY
jgi:hypothetical protein